MARLEEEVGAFTLVEEIRDGILKKDIIKKYKTSEQDLAKMLHPLYKSGEITKEEFNDFFKGIFPRKKETPPSREDEAPSQIFRALTEQVPAIKAAEEPIEEVLAQEVKEDVALPVPPPAPEAPAQPPLIAEVVTGELELDEELELEPEIIEDLEPEPAVEPAPPPTPEVPLAAVTTPVPPVPPAPQTPAEAVAVPTAPLLKAQAGQTVDSAGLTSFLQQVFAKLSSIDDRLAQIEKKLGS